MAGMAPQQLRAELSAGVDTCLRASCCSCRACCAATKLFNSASLLCRLAIMLCSKHQQGMRAGSCMSNWELVGPFVLCESAQELLSTSNACEQALV